MKKINFNAVEVWKQVEDMLVPRLEMSVIDRAVYSRLLRHSRLEGKSRLRFSIVWLARGVRLTDGPVRKAVRRLAAHGVLRLIERSKTGHLVEMRLPGEVHRGIMRGGIMRGGMMRGGMMRGGTMRGAMQRWAAEDGASQPTYGRRPRPSDQGTGSAPVDIEGLDFLRSRSLRKAIHAREGGRCFYCLGKISDRLQCLDHVQPRAHLGLNSYRNLVSSCMECNGRKGAMAAKDFLRWLQREQRLSPKEFARRLKALEELAAGKLRPVVSATIGLGVGAGRRSASALQ